MNDPYCPNLQGLMGSDAHAKKDVGAVANIGQIDGISFSEFLVENHVERLKRSKFYWMKKRLKSSRGYQFLLSMIPKEWRRSIKNRLLN